MVCWRKEPNEHILIERMPQVKLSGVSSTVEREYHRSKGTAGGMLTVRGEHSMRGLLIERASPRDSFSKNQGRKSGGSNESGKSDTKGSCEAVGPFSTGPSQEDAVRDHNG